MIQRPSKTDYWLIIDDNNWQPLQPSETDDSKSNLKPNTRPSRSTAQPELRSLVLSCVRHQVTTLPGLVVDCILHTTLPQALNTSVRF